MHLNLVHHNIYRITLSTKSVINLLVVVIISLFSQIATSKITFDQSQITTDFKITHKVKSANLLNLNNNQLLLFGEDKANNRILAIYELLVEEQQYSEVVRKIIPKHFLAFDLLKTKQHHKLIFLTQNKLIEYVAFNNQFKTLKTINTLYLQETADFLIDKDFINDINGDQLDDISLADFNHIHLLLQQANGSFNHQKLPVKPKVELSDNQASFTQTPFHLADMNRDNKKDIVIVKDKKLQIYSQLSTGNFDLTPFDLNLSVNIHALNWWEIKESDGNNMDQSNLAHRTVFDIKDINNDGLTDLIVLFNQTEGVLDRKNNYEVYLGQNNQGKLDYKQSPDSTITAEGTIAKFEFVDINNDKQLEVLVSSLDIGISQIIGALLSGSIDQDVYIFTLDQNGRYIEDPALSKEVDLNFSLSSGRSDDPVIKLADFNGDGLEDLLFSGGEERLLTYQASNKKRMFHKRSVKHKILLPKNGKLISTIDLDQDGKQDIVIGYGRQDDEKLNNRLVLLFSR
jgi:hypothetical protein